MIIHRWMQKQLLGLSVKNLDELKRAIVLGANMVEIKLEKFAENGMPFYTYGKDGRFYLKHKNLECIAAIAKKANIVVQFHMSIERCVDLKKDTGINVGFLSHHYVAILRFIMLEKIYREYGIGSVFTVHPPTISFDGKSFLKTKEALKNARIFFERLDEIRLKEKHQTLIGVENQTSPKLKAACLGDHAKHFKKMLRNTRTIGTTIDSGHRLLAKYFTVTELLGFSIPPVNFHFHGNAGVFKAENYDDDEHRLPTPHNVWKYKNYVRYFRRHRTPIVLELSYLEQYSDNKLMNFITNLKNKTE